MVLQRSRRVGKDHARWHDHQGWRRRGGGGRKPPRAAPPGRLESVPLRRPAARLPRPTAGQPGLVDPFAKPLPANVPGKRLEPAGVQADQPKTLAESLQGTLKQPAGAPEHAHAQLSVASSPGNAGFSNRASKRPEELYTPINGDHQLMTSRVSRLLVTAHPDQPVYDESPK